MENNYSFFDGLLEQVELEHSLFESTLRSKFRSIKVLKEDGDVNTQAAPDENPAPEQANQDTTSDDETKKWYEKIAEFIVKIWTKFKDIISQFIDKVKSVFSKDITERRLVHKFGKYLQDKNNLKGFPGIDNFREPIVGKYNNFKEALDKIAKMSDLLIDGTWFDDSIIKLKDESIKLTNEAFKSDEPTKGKWIPGDDYDFNMLARIELPAKEKFKFLMISADPNSLKSRLLTKLYGSSKEFKVQEHEKEIFSKVFGAYQEACKKFVENYREWIKNTRKAYIICGTYAFKTAEGEARENATPEQQAATESLVWLVDIQNSQYLDEAFSFI